MLQQQHNVGDRVRLPRRRQAPLQFPSSAIRHHAQVYQGAGTGVATHLLVCSQFLVFLQCMDQRG